MNLFTCKVQTPLGPPQPKSLKLTNTEPTYMIGSNPTEPAWILSRIQKLYSSIRRYYSKKMLRAGKIDRSLLKGESFELFKISSINRCLEALEKAFITIVKHDSEVFSFET
jgi:hypothetical protein